MLKKVLIAISICVVFDAAVFAGTYRQHVAGAAVTLVLSVVTQDWKLTHT